MRAVADTLVIVNLFSVFYPDRTETAKRVASFSDEGVIELYAPLFGKFEFAAVMSRYLSEGETLIKTVMYLDAVLLTNDKRMSELARACGIKSFYLIDESDEFFSSLEVGE